MMSPHTAASSAAASSSSSSSSSSAPPPEDLLRTVYPSEPSLKNLTSASWARPPEVPNPALRSLGRPHVDSFNYMLGPGLLLAVADLPVVEFSLPPEVTGQEEVRVGLRVTECEIESPRTPPGAVGVKSGDHRVFPVEARQRGGTYKGKCTVRYAYSVNGVWQPPMERCMGLLPVMLLSDACNLSGLSPRDLVDRGEQEQEWGGYFVIGGHERLIRMLQTTRRNYPIAMSRPSWQNRGKNFSSLGVLIECGKRDLTTVKNVLHYLTTGTAKLMFNVGKELFFVPVIMVLKCLSDRSDAGIFSELLSGVSGGGGGDDGHPDQYYTRCLQNMMVELQEEGLYTGQQVRDYLGRSFRERLRHRLPDWSTDDNVVEYILATSVCVHLDEKEDKFQLLAFMVKKLFALVQDRCAVEGVDSIMMHEIVLGGHLYLQLLKEKLHTWMYAVKANVLRKAKEAKAAFELTPKTLDWCANRTFSLERQFENFLGTGNLPSETGLGLMQAKGLTIMAENINRMRYMSHFRAIHRGSFFQEMRTTEVRALLPDAWGFVCPVHTPDGAPCGLLNHLAFPVEIVTHAQDASQVPAVLVALGMLPLGDARPDQLTSGGCYPVLLDGRLLGHLTRKTARVVVDKLRVLKVRDDDRRVPKTTEIVLVPMPDPARPSSAAPGGQFPGLFLFTGPARMVRPVVNLALNAIELIGTFEQIYLDICVSAEESYKGVTTHQEIRQTAFLSNLACTIPLPDFNQSPRNMYQCQMGKQTMATPTHTWHLNAETKMYRLQTPTSPFFRPAHYDHINMDDYPMGTNAVVAVISYTGYDMEDAMIINRSSFDRGFAAGSIYKCQFVDLREIATGRKKPRFDTNGADDLVFARDPKKPELADFLDLDGLPYPGTRLTEDDPFYSYCDAAEGVYVLKRYDGKETVYVDSVRLCGNETGTSQRNRVCIALRVPRNPSVGDKFASRAGQKGICSRLWPSVDLPWTESGLVPDVVFNPHGFPSRMTIAMMIECMAGKSGAVHGLVHDSTPFRFGEGGAKGTQEQAVKPDDAIDFFARHLEAAGYNYYGTETLYSGTDGVEMRADIFFGIIHYQRLRHMVSDKFQVRSVGAVDQITRQPIKGRRRGGGVRFGEMERDSLLSHGAVFLLQDRLFHGSDKTRVKICTGCGSLISPRVLLPSRGGPGAGAGAGRFRDVRSRCVTCGESGGGGGGGGDAADLVREIELPYIFLHLVWQLAAVNIKLQLETTHK